MFSRALVGCHAYGVVISAVALNRGYTPGGAARIFDTAQPGGFNGDTDLGSPNELCSPSGPGEGAGGAPDSNYANCDPQGMVLIIQESNKAIPDDNAGGGETSHFPSSTLSS